MTPILLNSECVVPTHSALDRNERAAFNLLIEGQR